MDLVKVLDVAQKIGMVGLLIAIIYGGYAGFWTYGSTYRDMVADRDQWKQLALKGTNLAVAASSRVVTGLPPSVEGHGPATPLPPDASRPQVEAAIRRVESRVRPISTPTETPAGL